MDDVDLDPNTLLAGIWARERRAGNMQSHNIQVLTVSTLDMPQASITIVLDSENTR
jgi:hypothetical protein